MLFNTVKCPRFNLVIPKCCVNKVIVEFTNDFMIMKFLFSIKNCSMTCFHRVSIISIIIVYLSQQLFLVENHKSGYSFFEKSQLAREFRRSY